MEYVLETFGLSKSYGRTKVLQNINMHIPKGSIYGFIGRNGAGKTSLMRVISGLQLPTMGEYSLYGVKHTNPNIRK